MWERVLITGGAILALCLPSCVDMSQKWHSSIVPETFYSTPDEVYSSMGEPYNQAMELLGSPVWLLQEATADQFVVLIRYGIHFNDGWDKMHRQTWDADYPHIAAAWNGIMTGIARCLDVASDLEKVDYPGIGLPEEDRNVHLAELDALMAFFLLTGLDLYGPLPLYTSVADPLKPRATAAGTFSRIEELLKGAIDRLPAKEKGRPLDRTLHRGAAAALLARLYFNAAVYTGTPMWNECGRLCEDIIAGKYGHYELDTDWDGPHGFANNGSPENIWIFPSELNKQQYNWFDSYFYNASIQQALGKADGGMNAVCLQPSRDKYGSLYTDADFRLGRPFEKFHAEDLRKRHYRYRGDGTREGMFLYGTQYKFGTDQPVTGFDEHEGQPYVLVGQVARYWTVGHPDFPSVRSVDDLVSDIWSGEDNSGLRIVKVPLPNGQNNPLRWSAGMPVIRLAEIYYMLAECKFRTGDKPGAAALLNRVRSRNFEGGSLPPGAAVPDDLDPYRLLDEWGIEFLGEGRRRTDLRRWGMFTTENWWDHTPSFDTARDLFPIPSTARAANSLLEQNPGY